MSKLESLARKLFFLLLIIVPCTMIKAQDHNLYQKKVYVNKGDTLPYRILFPVNMDKQKKYPLVIYFHGSALRGKDNEKQLKYGADVFLKEENRKKFPAIVVFPQCPNDSLWVAYQVGNDSISSRHLYIGADTAPTTPLRLATGLLTQLVHKNYVDRQRIYIGGQSLGALATFEMLWRYPAYFAAAFPIAGAGNPQEVKKYNKKTAIWVFHGAKDHIVPYINSKRMYNAMKQHGMKVKYTLYPGARHNSWDSAFDEKKLLPWIFSNHL